jgi:hypothetical protein
LLRVPYLVLRQQSWDLAIAFMNGVGAFFVSLRHTVTMATWFLVSAAVVLFAHNKPLLWTAMLILLALLVITYVRRAATALKKSRLFIVQEKIVALLPKIRRKMFALEDKLKDKPYEQLTPEEANTWKQRLTISLILNRLCLFAARKLRAYGESAWAKLAPAFTAVMLFAATTVTFALTNLAAFKLIPDSFVLTASPGLILFVHYSFNRMVFNTIPEVVPKHSVAILLYDLEAMFSVLLGLVFISLILTMRRERQTAEMNRTIESFGEQGRIIEQGIVSEYHFRNIDDAISALEKVQQGVTAVLYNIAERI